MGQKSGQSRLEQGPPIWDKGIPNGGLAHDATTAMCTLSFEWVSTSELPRPPLGCGSLDRVRSPGGEQHSAWHTGIALVEEEEDAEEDHGDAWPKRSATVPGVATRARSGTDPARLDLFPGDMPQGNAPAPQALSTPDNLSPSLAQPEGVGQ